LAPCKRSLAPSRSRRVGATLIWVDEDPDFERLAPVPLSVACFRVVPRNLALDIDALDTLNADLLTTVNASGEVFLSHTRLKGRYTLRLAVGHIRTSETHVRRAWQIIRASLSGMLRHPSVGRT
jgi:aromatic-L-amino-acid decarboxylase